MVQIKIILFLLTSFFEIGDGRIAADKTIVTIDPNIQKIEIIQENLVTFIQSEKDTILILEQWDKLQHWKERKTSWIKELDNFPVKNLTFTSIKDSIQSHLTLTYSKEIDLQMMGIWYDSEKDQFSIDHVPYHNIKTENGKLVDNYWIFDGEKKFSFTIEPFLEIPEIYEELKTPIKKILIDNKLKD